MHMACGSISVLLMKKIAFKRTDTPRDVQTKKNPYLLITKSDLKKLINNHNLIELTIKTISKQLRCSIQ